MLKLNELKNIQNPSRYIGGEAGEIIKRGQFTCKTVFAVPMPYEMGSINFNLRQMYYSVNKRKDSSLERVFAVMQDFEELLKEKEEPLYSLETKTPLDKFDILFTELSNPLMYTTFLHMLRLSNIPLKRDIRDEEYPVIIATGDGITNPNPMSKFIDVFVIGDLYYVVDKILDKYVLCKRENASREDFLKSISFIDGVYIPSIHKTQDKTTIAINKKLNLTSMPSYQVTPSISQAADSVIVPLTYGCGRNCSMCKHKYMYTNVEPKSVEKAIKDISIGVEATGNTHVTLMTNCYGDYFGFPELTYKLQDLEKPKIRELNFMEVKLNMDNTWLIPYLKEQYKRTGEVPTIIVGATNEKLRQILGIDITDDEVLQIARKIFRADFTKIRLKYVIGTPKETYEDLNDIFDLASKITKIYFEEYSKLPEKYIVEVDVYSFTGDAHTPMQYAAVNNLEKLQMKAKYLSEKNTHEYVKLTFENFEQNEVMTVLGRGNEKLSDAIYSAEAAGANLEFIPQFFNYDTWKIALNRAKIDVKELLEEKAEDYVFPWDNIEVGTTKEELKARYFQIMKGKSNENSSNK